MRIEENKELLELNFELGSLHKMRVYQGMASQLGELKTTEYKLRLLQRTL